MTVAGQKLTRTWVDEIVNTVAEFGSASLGLVAWELCLAEEQLRDAWEQTLDRGWLEPTGPDGETGEEMFRLVAPRRQRILT